MNRTEEEIINSFKDALANGDVQTLQYMLSFAGNYQQMAMNIRHYEQYLSCGYTGKPSFDKYGWIENGKELKENIETVEVFEDNGKYLSIELLQLANGNWVHGIRLGLSERGYAGGADIWGTQYATRHDAYLAALKRALKMTSDSAKSTEMKYIKVIKEKMAESKQLCLF